MNNRLINFLRSNIFAIYIAIASVIVQSFHTFYAFYKVSSLNGSIWGVGQACLFAIIVDAAVLFYTVRKNTQVTWMFAFIMVLINLYVYYTHLGISFDFILGALISLIIPVSNYFYSEEIDLSSPDKTTDDTIAKLNERLIIERQTWGRLLDEAQVELRTMGKDNVQAEISKKRIATETELNILRDTKNEPSDKSLLGISSTDRPSK